MSKLYSTISGDGRAQDKTRCAHREVSAAAQSWEGSIIVSIHIEDDGLHQACIEVSNGSDTSGRIIWSGPLADLIGARRIITVEEHLDILATNESQAEAR